MATKYDLEGWLVEALRALGGEGTIPRICEQIWRNHENDLRESGDLFFTWQYDIRWAAQRLRDQRVLVPTAQAPRGFWQLAGSSAA
jgi:hypothetical protein